MTTSHITPADARRQFAEEVAEYLQRTPRQLPSKYFYDALGSELFDRICELPEYYPTRTELAILRRSAAEMAGRAGRGAESG